MTEPEATTDLNELFSRDPLKLTDSAIEKIVAEYREKRRLFNSNPGAVKGKRATTSKKTDERLKGLNINIDI